MKSIGFIMAAALLLGGCANEYQEYSEEQRVSMANPAAVFCVQQGGELVTETENNQRITYCDLPNEERVEQWEYFRNSNESKNES